MYHHRIVLSLSWQKYFLASSSGRIGVTIFSVSSYPYQIESNSPFNNDIVFYYHHSASISFHFAISYSPQGATRTPSKRRIFIVFLHSSIYITIDKFFFVSIFKTTFHPAPSTMYHAY